MDKGGKLVFERPVPTMSVAATDYWKEKKVEQLQDVRANAMLQLFQT